MKFYGPIGYAEMVETSPGVWDEKITEHMYFGDLTRNTRRLQSAETLNDDINIANEISIVADPFATRIFMPCDMLSLWARNGKFLTLKYSIRD